MQNNTDSKNPVIEILIQSKYCDVKTLFSCSTAGLNFHQVKQFLL